jgi:hypothetical protein
MELDTDLRDAVENDAPRDSNDRTFYAIASWGALKRASSRMWREGDIARCGPSTRIRVTHLGVRCVVWSHCSTRSLSIC